MSPPQQENLSAAAKRPFDAIKAPWFSPLAVFLLLVTFRVLAPGLAERTELFWLDQALRVRAELDLATPLDDSIRFVELSMNDDIARRFAEDGEYATAASILRTLASLGVRVIAVDIVYTYGRAEDQALLANAIEEIHAGGLTTVVLSMSTEPQAKTPRLLKSLPLAGGDQFLQGVVNVTADKNWKEYQFVHRFEEETIPSLALAAFGASRSGPLAPQQVADGRMEWKDLGPKGKAVTKSADESRLFLNLPHSYYESRFDDKRKISGRVWTIAALETLAARSIGTRSPLQDTIVFFGFDAETDGKPTTHGDMEPGMFLHGTALNDLIHGTAIRPAPLWLDLLLYLLVAVLAAGAFSVITHKRWLFIVALTGTLVILVGGWLAVWQLNLLLGTINSTFLWGIAIVLEVGRRWTFEQRGRLQRDAMLGFYFSPAVLKQVTQNLDMIRPQGNEVAILLSDLRGFTTLCETQPVERVFELLNRLFAIETDAALREDGSLARFAGDQFLAYWGAPEPCNDAADRALRAALEIQRTMKARRENPADDLDSWLHIGIGMHRGRGLVGHVGSRSYRDYNIVGDSVNTTARLESQTKNYVADIIASGEFVAALSSPPANLLVDRVQVKGKAKPTDLYAVFDEFPESRAEGCRQYETAFKLYVTGSFAAAGDGFNTLTDHPCETIAASARLLGARCRGLVNTPPAKWNGVFELTSK